MNSQTENWRGLLSTSRKFWKPALILAPLVALAGCSGGPKRLLPPHIDAEDAAEQALETYDQDGDGFIAGEELEAAPALNASMSTLDTNKDGKVSELEIAERIRSWQATRAGVTSVRCYVTMNGNPLEGATVIFEPETFLGDEIQVASGSTNFAGIAAPSIPKENRPMPDMPPGLQLGLYRVKVSKIVNGQETIPAKYNSETILGQQAANDDPAMLRHKVILDLKK